jgi:hypothetical protein
MSCPRSNKEMENVCEATGEQKRAEERVQNMSEYLQQEELG